MRQEKVLWRSVLKRVISDELILLLYKRCGYGAKSAGAIMLSKPEWRFAMHKAQHFASARENGICDWRLKNATEPGG